MRSVLKLCVLCVIFTAVAQAQQKPCLTASKFGPADQIGNVNYITPAKTLAASKLVTSGKTYRLGVETNKDTPAYPPRTFAISVVQPGQVAGTADEVHPAGVDGRLGRGRVEQRHVARGERLE